ncbi:hypothetical protein HPP92_008474 [Vanilla planifolia]|uniref:Uncharacterized protein n=1 Tax=Vanilla planifolia TaxID=51239 RepID=A0A835R8F2_VANPL|nr:hypothetical protein HPP92_008474 [Vanilla planifolia]
MPNSGSTPLDLGLSFFQGSMRTESLNREGSTCVRPRDVRTIGGSSTGVFGNGDDDGGGAARRTSESNSLGKRDTSVHQVDSTAAKPAPSAESPP